MLCRSLAQLLSAMTLAAFAQEVDYGGSGSGGPFRRLSSVDKSQHLDLVQMVVGASPFADMLYGVEFARRDSCRRHFDTRDAEFLDKQSEDAEFLTSGETHA